MTRLRFWRAWWPRRRGSRDAAVAVFTAQLAARDLEIKNLRDRCADLAHETGVLRRAAVNATAARRAVDSPTRLLPTLPHAGHIPHPRSSS